MEKNKIEKKMEKKIGNNKIENKIEKKIGNNNNIEKKIEMKIRGDNIEKEIIKNLTNTFNKMIPDKKINEPYSKTKNINYKIRYHQANIKKAII